MSTEDARWPRLKLGVHLQLDWVGIEYTKEWLLEMADAVRKSRYPIQTKAGVLSPVIEGVLRSLAENNKALKELNQHRPTPPSDVVALNRAVHFYVVFEMLPDGRGRTTDAWHKVAAAWGRRDDTVKDDVARFRVNSDDGCIFRDGVHDARYLMEHVVALGCAKTGKSRPQVLEDFNSDMWDRAEPYRSQK